MPFLTDIDSRASVKGSRDPLGLVPLWSRFGRKVVGNLTTVSDSVRGFSTLLLGYYFAEQARSRGDARSQSTLDLFLKFEQLAGYVRWHVNRDDRFRGRDRVVLRHGESTKVALSAAPADQILGNQRTYGLWGLFSVPARSSGLLAPGEPVLTEVARRFVEKQYIARLTADGIKDGRPVVDMIRRERAEVYLDGRDANAATALARILSPRFSEAERVFYDRHLARGGEDDATQGKQPLLADLLGQLPDADPFDMQQLRAVSRAARRRDTGVELADVLSSICYLESLLVPMESTFAFLLTRDRQSPSSVAGDIRRAWGVKLRHVDPAAIQSLEPAIAHAFGQDAGVANRFTQTADAFAKGAYEDALPLLVAHNSYIMQQRNGSQPWVRLEGGKLDVRYRDESRDLIPGDELPGSWRNTYFINSLKSVVSTLAA